MKLNINLKMDKRWFALIFASLVIIVLFLANYGHPIVQVVENNNCSCHEKSWDGFNWHTIEYNGSDQIITPDFENCHQIPCPQNRSGCLVYHMECD